MDIAKRTLVNQNIRADIVRLIGADGSQLGIMPIQDALKLAEEGGLDLVEVAPNADPPVCRIMDYGKYKYQQNKKVKEAKKRSTTVQIKEVKFRPKTDDHDVNTKIGHARNFLAKRHKLKMTVMFRGREMMHVHVGQEQLKKVAAMLDDVAVIESGPKMEGRHLSLIMAPRPEAFAKTKGPKSEEDKKTADKTESPSETKEASTASS